MSAGNSAFCSNISRVVVLDRYVNTNTNTQHCSKPQQHSLDQKIAVRTFLHAAAFLHVWPRECCCCCEKCCVSVFMFTYRYQKVNVRFLNLKIVLKIETVRPKSCTRFQNRAPKILHEIFKIHPKTPESKCISRKSGWKYRGNPSQKNMSKIYRRVQKSANTTFWCFLKFQIKWKNVFQNSWAPTPPKFFSKVQHRDETNRKVSGLKIWGGRGSKIGRGRLSFALICTHRAIEFAAQQFDDELWIWDPNKFLN